MTPLTQEFSRLLTQAIHFIKSREAKQISAIQDDLGYAVGRTGATIEGWRKGRLPAKHTQTEKLVRVLVEKTTFDRNWFQRFLRAAAYPDPEKLLDQLPLVPLAAEPNHFRINRTPTINKNEPVGQWLPMPVEVLPNRGTLIGRHQLLLTLQQQLETSHFILISGMPGIGKTALAAALLATVQRPKQQIFWHTCHQGEGIGDLIWRLVNFFAWHGLQEALHWLSNHSAVPPLVFFESLLYQIQGQGYLLCFDNFHLLDAPLIVDHLLYLLKIRAQQGGLDIMIITRTMPKLGRMLGIQAINGLSCQETATLLTQQGVEITASTLADLHILTCGNPQFLLLAIAHLKHLMVTKDFLYALVDCQQIESYMLQEIDEQPTPSERAIMRALSILGTSAGTVGVIEAIANLDGSKQILTTLVDRHLLICHYGATETTYSQPMLIQQYFYATLTNATRWKMHKRAGHYYTVLEPHAQKAAAHIEAAITARRGVPSVTNNRANW